MLKTPFGPRAHLAILAVAGSALLGSAVPALADTTQPTLYHVQENTFGCGDPATTRLLTDPSEPRRTNAAWMRTTVSNGRCVTITPRSPWKLVTLDNGVALMEYAGTVGAPGSYYILASDLVDPVGQHPGDAAAPAAGAPAPASSSSATAPAAAPNAAETALAPAPQDVPVTATPVAFHGSWSTWDVLLLLLAISIAGVVGYIVGRNTRKDEADYLSK